MFHLQGYFASIVAPLADQNLAAVPDTIFSDRNGAFIYTEDWSIPFLFSIGLTEARVRSSLPKLNAIGRHNIFGLNRSATVPSPLNLQDLRKEPLTLSRNEPLLWQLTNDGAGAESDRVFQGLVSPNWSMELPEHLQRITVRITAAAAGVADSWGADVAITFPDQDLRGGVYSIIGCQLFDAGTIAYRFILPRQKPEQGRLLRPGGIACEAIGNIPHPIFNAGLGEWGRFHTFELPRLQIYANATAASAQVGFLDLLYLGEDEALLDGTM